jgi:hypothetical protein
MPSDRKLFAFTQLVLEVTAIGIPILIGFMVIGMAAVPFAAHLVPFDAIERAAGVTVTADDVVRLGEAGLVGAIAMFTLATLIVRRLLRIVESASAGDPFVEQNAVHLSAIGWLLVGIYAVEALMAVAVSWLSSDAILARMHGQGGFEFPLGGLFAVLLIFVLARIFRRGTEMRAELEGTV